VLFYLYKNRLSFITVSPYICQLQLRSSAGCHYIITVGYMYLEADGQSRTGQSESLLDNLLTVSYCTAWCPSLMHLMSGLDAYTYGGRQDQSTYYAMVSFLQKGAGTG
jgi:hypothetical protein